MRSSHPLCASLALLVCSFGSACKEEVTEICDLPTSSPDVADGTGEAKRSDGAAFSEDATWNPGAGGSLTIGVLDMIIEKEESGSDTADIIEDGAFPICVRLGERGETTGSANYIDGGFVTSAGNTGSVAILSNDEDILVGRFAVDLANPQGEELSFTDGAFAARLR